MKVWALYIQGTIHIFNQKPSRENVARVYRCVYYSIFDKVADEEVVKNTVNAVFRAYEDTCVGEIETKEYETLEEARNGMLNLFRERIYFALRECEIITNTDASTLIRQAGSLLNGASNKLNTSNIEETQQELDELYNIAFILQKEIDKLKERV